MPFSISRDTRRHFHSLIAVCALLGSAWLIGCGSGDETASSDSGSSDRPATDQSADHDPQPRTGESPPVAVTNRDDRTNWIGDIPYDVYFDRPLEVYRDMTLVAGTPNGTPIEMPDVAPDGTDPKNGGTTKPETTDPAGAPVEGGEFDWAKLASIDVLFEEATDIRNRLNTNLQTVATYNRDPKGVVTDGNVLATIAGVIEMHPGEGSWKEKAKFIRSLGYDIYLNAGVNGRPAFEGAREPFEQIVTMMSGGPPPDIEVEDEFYFPDVADRAELMKRIEATFGWLRSNINTPTRLEEETEETIRAATVMAVMGQVMTDPDFDNADEPMYQEMFREFIEGNSAAVQAAEAGNFTELEAAINRVNNSCAPCHSKYRTRDSEF